MPKFSLVFCDDKSVNVLKRVFPKADIINKDDVITVGKFAAIKKTTSKKVIQLLLSMGVMKTVNQTLTQKEMFVLDKALSE